MIRAIWRWGAAKPRGASAVEEITGERDGLWPVVDLSKGKGVPASVTPIG